jgi:hypothetical protein
MPVGLSPGRLAYKTVNCSEYHPLTPTRHGNSDSQNPPGEGDYPNIGPQGISSGFELYDATVSQRHLTRRWSLRYVSATMAKYITRSCPKCHDQFYVVVSEPSRKGLELSINGFCAVCGYTLNGWRLILGRNHKVNECHGRIRKVFS